MKPRTACLLIVLAGCLSACDSGDPGDNGEEELRTLYLGLNGVHPLPADYHYEGWAFVIEENTTVVRSTGKFNVDTEGDPVDLGGTIIDGNLFTTDFDLSTTLRFIITIEPPGDTDATPSSTRMLGGIIQDHEATLTASDEYGLDGRLSQAAGTYILSTPTDGPDTNELSGLWFINLTAGPAGRGLRIQFPVPGWKYQGWVLIDGIPLSTGIVTGLSDSDDSSLYHGPLPGYNYPGEDFITNAPPGLTFPGSIAGARVLVTLEPSPDPDPGRSPLVILRGSVPGEPQSDTTYNLENNLAAFPTGNVRIRTRQ